MLFLSINKIDDNKFAMYSFSTQEEFENFIIEKSQSYYRHNYFEGYDIKNYEDTEDYVNDTTNQISFLVSLYAFILNVDFQKNMQESLIYLRSKTLNNWIQIYNDNNKNNKFAINYFFSDENNSNVSCGDMEIFNKSGIKIKID